jgi:hypothetical protein
MLGRGSVLSSRSYPHCPAGASREPRRTLPVAPLIADKRCYGECPASVRGGHAGGMEISRSSAVCGRRRAAHRRSLTLTVQITGEHSYHGGPADPVALSREKSKESEPLGQCRLLPICGTAESRRRESPSRPHILTADGSCSYQGTFAFAPSWHGACKRLAPEWILPCQTQLETGTGAA